MTEQIVVEAADGRRIWTITRVPNHGFDCNGLYLDPKLGWTMLGHSFERTEEAAIIFCKRLTGPKPTVRRETRPEGARQ